MCPTFSANSITYYWFGYTFNNFEMTNEKWPLIKVSSTWIRILFKLGDSGERIALWSRTTPSRQKSRTSKGQIEREKCLSSSLNHWPGNGFKNVKKNILFLFFTKVTKSGYSNELVTWLTKGKSSRRSHILTFHRINLLHRSRLIW